MGTEDITSGGDMASAYPLMHGSPVRKPTGLAADYSDQHGFNLPGKAEQHAAPSGEYSAEQALDRFGGDGDDDGRPPQDDKQQNGKKQSSSGSSSDSSDSDDDDE